MPFADDEIRSVLARAQEIERVAAGDVPTPSDVEALVHAAEEVGISRAAVERALRERLQLPGKPPAEGDLVFARSADGKFYVAHVESASEDGFHVRFLRGGEHTVSLDQLRPCSLLPGERVTCSWPNWGAWTCSVVSYDAANRRVSLSDGWSETRVFPLEEVWLNAPREASAARRERVYAALIGTGLTVGAILGSVITTLLMR